MCDDFVMTWGPGIENIEYCFLVGHEEKMLISGDPDIDVLVVQRQKILI